MVKHKRLEKKVIKKRKKRVKKINDKPGSYKFFGNTGGYDSS